MIGKLKFVALVVVAAAFAAPLAQASSDPGFARAYLQQLGLTKAQAVSWTTGVCSYRDKPASCELTSDQAALASQRLAQSMGAPAAPRISYDRRRARSSRSTRQARIRSIRRTSPTAPTRCTASTSRARTSSTG